jgi:hypothetical protein
MRGVGDHALAGIDQHRLQAPRAEGCRHQLAGEALTKGEHVVGGAGRELPHRRNSAQQLVERIEVGFQFRMNLAEDRGVQQFGGGVVVPFPDRARKLQPAVAVAGSGGARHGQQLIGNFRHGADYDHRILRQSAADDLRGAINRGGILHRGAAEFHDYSH